MMKKTSQVVTRGTGRLGGEIVAACRARQWRKAVQSWERVAGQEPDDPAAEDVSVKNLVVSACAQCRQWQIGIDVLATIPVKERNRFTYKAGLVAWQVGQSWQGTCALLEEARQQKVEVTKSSFSSLVNSCKTTGQWKAAVVVLEEMVKQGVAVDIATLGAVVAACKIGAAWETSLQCLENAKVWKVMPNTIFFNALIGCCGEAGKWQQTLELISAMEQEHKLTPTSSTMSTSMSALAKSSRWMHSLALYHLWRPRVQPSVSVESAFITACDKGQQWPTAVQHLECLRRDMVKMDLVAYNAALRACGRGGSWSGVLAVLETLRSQRLRPSVVTLNSSISSTEASHYWPAALRLLRQFPAHDQSPDIISYNATLSVFSKASEWQRAQELFAELRGGKCLNSTAAQEVERKQQQSQPQFQLQPNLVTLSTMVSAFGAAREWHRSLQLLDEHFTAAELVGPSPDQSESIEKENHSLFATSIIDVATVNSVIDSLRSAEQWQKSLVVLDRMGSSSVDVNAVTLGMLAECLDRSGQSHRVPTLLMRSRSVARLGAAGATALLTLTFPLGAPTHSLPMVRTYRLVEPRPDWAAKPRRGMPGWAPRSESQDRDQWASSINSSCMRHSLTLLGIFSSSLHDTA
eukprot:CAMPEP_0206541446 /NCGR_PEP_ID=MMETSP0325_2-20121206/9612_1 /ASSEMBLY_ACC=CAM_ASM_000347 /TAXON_ID=2866 /ORGANISM="Crypthecodinium cohnii, Strain Seligo" /LENGTH=634 /DNA_ID=CAMNT_0054039375 /DNA_START=37 /DNA_END=1941 /DNA_ORIENTATION=+